MKGKQWKRAAEAVAKDKFERALLTRISSVSLFADSVWEELVAVTQTADGLVRVFRSNVASDDPHSFWEMSDERHGPRITIELPALDD